MLSVPSAVGNKVNQLANFKELSIGSGARILKANMEGAFLGATKFSTAPLKLYYDGKIYSGVSSTSSILIDGSDGAIYFKYNGTTRGEIYGWQQDVEGENEGLVVGATSGAQLRFRISNVGCNGNFNPAESDTFTMGNTGNYWSEIWANKIVATDTGGLFSCQGSDGIDGTFGYTDDNDQDHTLEFKGGILIDQN